MTAIEAYDKLSEGGVPITEDMFLAWVRDNSISAECLDNLAILGDMIIHKKQEDHYEHLLRRSRIPDVDLKTFDNFRYDRYDGEAVKVLKNLSSLYFLNSGCNVLFTGEPGTGKTHLALAIGNEACRHGIRTYYTTFSDLNTRLTLSIRKGTTAKEVKKLMDATCLIIDDIGRETFSERNTELLFNIISKRQSSKRSGSIIMTSNLRPSEWGPLFSSGSTLECTLDRLLDKVEKFELKGSSFRGRDRHSYQLEVKETQLSVKRQN